jgi:predicted MarR family transcription regulator
MQSNTIFTLDGARLDKAELDILHFVDSWMPTFNRWSVTEIAQKCNLFAPDAAAAVDMLILHGLMENDGEDALMGRMVQVPDIAQQWIVLNSEDIHNLYYMNDTSLFGDDETATA